MLSGLLHDYHPEHLDRIQRELSESGGDTERIPVATCRLADLFEEHGIERVEWDDVYAHPAVLDDGWRRKRARDPRVQRLARLGPLPGAAAAALALAAAALGVAPSLALPLTSVFVSLAVLGFWARRVVAA